MWKRDPLGFLACMVQEASSHPCGIANNRLDGRDKGTPWPRGLHTVCLMPQIQLMAPIIIMKIKEEPT
jgi:hypothetical protein